MDEVIDQPVVVDPPQGEADALAKVFEEQVTGVAEEPSEADIALIQDASVSLEWLQDLRYTISQEGVSSDDVRMLFDIRNKMRGMGVELQMSPSLEAYGAASFTAQRSHLNITISNEGIVDTVVDTIKAWLKWFKDYLIKAVRFVLNMKHADDQVKRRVDKAAEAVKKIRETTFEFRKWGLNQAKHEVELQAFAKTLFTDKVLPRTQLTFALMTGGFGVGADLIRFHLDTQKAIRTMNQNLASLAEFFQGKVDQPNLRTDLTLTLKAQNAKAADWLVVDPDVNFLAKNAYPEFFQDPFGKDLLTPLNYEFVVESYQRASDFLRSIKAERVKVADDMLSLAITQAINFVNDSYLEVGKLIPFYVEINKTRLRLIAQSHKYWNKAYTLAYDDLTVNNLLTAAQRKAAEQLESTLKNFLGGLGLA